MIIRTRLVENRRLEEAYAAAMDELYHWRHVARLYDTHCEFMAPKVVKVREGMPSFSVFVGEGLRREVEEIRLHRLTFLSASLLPFGPRFHTIT